MANELDPDGLGDLPWRTAEAAAALEGLKGPAEEAGPPRGGGVGR